jgi:biopolymer transport protein ExbB
VEALWRTLEYLQQGGWIMIPLLLCSVTMWALIAERIFAFVGLSAHDIDTQAAIDAMRRGRMESGSTGLLARLVRSFLAERSGYGDLDRHVLRVCAARLRPVLHRFLPVVGVLAAIAPLLGLGMIETFAVLSIFGTGNAKALAGGISVALVTTQSGLLIAIPGLFFSGALERRAAKLETRLDELVHTLERHV